MKPLLRTALLFVIAITLAACATSGGRRISEPAASIQQLTVDAQGNWNIRLRLQNYSSVAMVFDRVALELSVDESPAIRLDASPALAIGPESADVTNIAVTPDASARLQIADALAAGRSVRYQLKGRLTATPDAGRAREFDISRNSALSPAPGLPGVLR